MSSYTPAQIDDANLAYHYTTINYPEGVYHQLRTGAQGFPVGFWATQRYITQIVWKLSPDLV